MKPLLAPAAVLACVAAAFGYVGVVDPNQPGRYPLCPLRRCTGLWCPGCGGLRSAHALVHGHLGTALGANAVAVAGYGGFAVAWAVWVAGSVRRRPWPALRARPWWPWAIGAVLAVFTVVRNLPVGARLHP